MSILLPRFFRPLGKGQAIEAIFGRRKGRTEKPARALTSKILVQVRENRQTRPPGQSQRAKIPNLHFKRSPAGKFI
jgi:hypothetical protein